MNMNKYINQIIHGDCLSELKNIPDNCVDCIITSPPYLSARNYTGEKNQFGYFSSKEK